MNQSSRKSAKQILLVENSNTARLTIGREISKLGYNVFYAATGREALTTIASNPIDLVVMDLFLPEMNGYEAAEQIRKIHGQTSDIPIFAHTASENEFDRKRCLEAGMDEYIIKSVNNKKLLDFVTQYLEKN